MMILKTLGYRTALVGLFAFALGLSPVTAQTIRVIVVEEGSGNPAASSLVSLLLVSGVRVAQGLTDQVGQVTLSAPQPGRYLVRGDRIGFVGRTSDPVELSAGRTVTLRFTLPMTRFTLPEVTVQAESKCTTGGVARRDISAVWEEARKALTSAVLTRQQFRPVLQVTGYERQRDAGGRLVREDTSYVRRGTGAPFHTLPVDTLMSEGFSREEGDSRMFYAPDARILLHDGFLETHCFALTEDRTGGIHRVGLQFTPTPGRTVPDIAGTLWLDAVENLLQEVEFEYVNVPPPWDGHHANGFVRFERIQGLGWIVNDWMIRIPRMVAMVGPMPSENVRRTSGSGRRTVTRFEDIDVGRVSPDLQRRFLQQGVVEQTGSAELVNAQGRTRPALVSGGTIAGVIHDSITGTGLGGVQVALEGGANGVVTDVSGGFSLSIATNGQVRVRVSHPRLQAFAIPSRHEVSVQPGGTARLDLATPSSTTWLTEQCGARLARDERVGGILGQVINPGDSTPVSMTISWDRASIFVVGEGVGVKSSMRTAEITVGAQGRFHLCSVPVGVPLDIRVNDDAYRFSAKVPLEGRLLVLRLEIPETPPE